MLTKNGNELIHNTGAWSISIYDMKTKARIFADPEYSEEGEPTLIVYGDKEMLELLDFYASKYPDHTRYSIHATRNEHFSVAKRRLALPPSKKLRAVKKEST